MQKPAGQLQRALEAHFPRRKAFLALIRFDKPIGTYLLLWPTLMALWIASEGWPGWHLFLVFGIGTLLTRSAGCVLNDLTDRRFDGAVKRTEKRPLVTGEVDVAEAWLFAASLLFAALLLVLSTNLYTVILSAGAVLITAAYPFMKRYTYLPQAVLGMAFSWGILMAFTAATREIPQVAWLLLIANLLWVVAYDTEYAMVDRDDDLKLGLKSTAILFADLDRPMIAILQASALVTLLLVGRAVEMSYWYYLGMSAATGLFLFQHYLIRSRRREDCFDAFLNNHWVGLSLFLGVVVHYLVA